MTDEKQYSVSIYRTRASLPFSLFLHTYLVAETDEDVNRFDVFARFTLSDQVPYHGLIYKNLLPKNMGLLILYNKKTWSDPEVTGGRWGVRRVATCTGGENSPAHRLYSLINSDKIKQYPHASNYRFVFGPNCNTFTQWVVDQVPECNLRLPWNAWGKGY